MKKISFSSCIVLFISLLFLPIGFAQDTPQWQLPDGVNARIGKGRANDVALSPDGRQLAVATGIGVWLYNAQTGAEIALLTGHTSPVVSVAYSPNGKTLASGSSREIRLWNPSTHAHKTTFVGQGANSLAYSPEGRTLAAGQWQGVDLLNAQTGERKSFLSGHTGSVTSFAFSPDGKRLASATDYYEDTTIRLWNARTGKLLRTLSGHANSVHSLAFSPDGNTLASGGHDGTIRVWDAKTGKQTRTLQEWSNALAYSPDGRQLAVSQGASLLLWNANTGQLQQTLIGHTNGSRPLVFSSDSSTLVSNSWDGTIGFWNIETGARRLTIEGHFNFRATTLSPNGKTVATLHEDDIFFWNTQNGQFNKVLDGVWGSNRLVYSPDGKTLAIDTWNDGPQIHLLNARTGQSKRILRLEGDGASSIAFSPNSKTLASGSWDGTIRVWNTQNGKLQRTLSGHTESITTLVFSPDGKTLASGSWDSTIRLWTPQTGQLQRTLEGRRGGVESLAFSPNGTTLASGNWDGLHFWNPQNGQIKQIIEGVQGRALAFSADGQTLAVGGLRVVHLLNARTGKIQRALSGPPESVAYLAFTPDGNTLVSHGWDQAILLWDMNKLPERIPEDINFDGVVDVEDLIIIARHLGESVAEGMHPNPDVTGDGVVNRQDVLKILDFLDPAAGAPVSSQTLGVLTAKRLQHWINNAKQLGNTDEAFQRGIAVLEELLTTLTTETKATPVETALLPNYPNPLNPETWLPYQLATAGEVSMTIYDVRGSVVRYLHLGYQPAGIYERRSRAAYWDGRNAVGEPVASGVYFYTLTAGEFIATRKMLIKK